MLLRPNDVIETNEALALPPTRGLPTTYMSKTESIRQNVFLSTELESFRMNMKYRMFGTARQIAP